MRSFILFCSFFLIITEISFGQYFQQNADYNIDAELYPADHYLKFISTLDYSNNSPDTLKEIYMHLYWNIFKKDSYSRKSTGGNNLQSTPPTDGVEINKITVAGYESKNYVVDNTIMKIPLSQKLKPGESLTIVIEASETVPATRLRMGRSGRDYAVAQWFPSVCVYDKLGWQIDQYLGQGEFNEEISNCKVNITLPSSYLVYYTGELLNPNEVLPEEAIKNLDTAKKSGNRTRIYNQDINPPARNDSITLTWRFKADNVRTFAFAAFENKIWDAQYYDGIAINTIYPSSIENYYFNEGMKAAVHAVKFFSNIYGPYPYKNVFVTAIDNMGGGMEYPGITFVSATTPSDLYEKVNSMTIIHEIGHNWCPMTINSNETKFAFMDEGFTEYWTMKAMEEMYGKEDNLLNPTGFLKSILPPVGMANYDYYVTAENQLSGLQEPILTHSDRYKSSNNYEINSYQKTACILSMLKYVMGDSAYYDLFHAYYNEYKFKHVYPEDFYALAEKINYKYNGKKDLSWFFDEWFAKSSILDLGLEDFEYEKVDGKYETTITIEQEENAVMPCDVCISFDGGRDTTVRFEAEDFFKGSTKASKTFSFNSEPNCAVIDPQLKLLDVNRLNNSSAPFIPITFRINPLIDILKLPRPDKYTIFWLPAFSFNNIDGFKLGMNLNGTYFTGRKNFELTVTQGMKFGKGSTGGDLTLSDNPQFLGPLADASLRVFNYEGRRGGEISVNKTFKSYSYLPQYGFSISVNYFDAYDDRYFDSKSFDIIPGQYPNYIRQRKYFWVNTKINYSDYKGLMSYAASTNYEAGFSIIPGNRKNGYQKAEFNLKESLWLPIIWQLKLRQYIGYSPGSLPAAKSFYLATVNPIDEFSSYIYRSPGIISNSARQKRSIPNGGGYLRGYYNQNDYGDMIFSFNSETNIGFLLEPIPYLGYILRHTTWFFADAGNVWNISEKIRMKDLLFDYGFSIKLPLRTNAIAYTGSNVFSFLTKLGISSINFDFPIYVSHPVPGEKKFKFRWLFGFQSPL